MGFTLALLGACREQPRAPGAPTTDRRELIEVSGPVQAAIRLEMRTMLGSLSDILRAGARGDTGAMREAAARSGLATAADPALEKLLPAEFLQLGMSTHRQFDDLGAALQRGMTPDSVLARLARLTGNCVICHATYRLSADDRTIGPRSGGER